MKNGEREDVRISGSGKVSGGEYEKLSISGTGEVTGDGKAEEVFVAGTAKFRGDLFAREINVTGSCTIKGSLEAEKIVIRGGLTVEGEVNAGEVNSYGSLKVGESLIGDDVYFAGSAEIGVDLESEKFVSRGSFKIGELLTADYISIWLGSNNSAGEIGGGTIEIRNRGFPMDINQEKIKQGVENLERGLDKVGERIGFSLELDKDKISSGLTKVGEKITHYVNEIGDRKLEASLIEGDELVLEGVIAEMARGRKVVIGEDCVIDKVEYSDTIDVDKGSKVKNLEKV